MTRLWVLVREAAHGDAGALAGLLRAEAEHAREVSHRFRLDPVYDWQSRAERKLADTGRQLFVAEDRGKLVGFVDVHLRRPPRPKRRGPWYRLRTRFKSQTPIPVCRGSGAARAVIEGCYVVEAARRRRVGTALVQQAQDWGRQRGATQMEIVVLAQNTAALQFWSAHGFEPTQWAMALSLDSSNGKGGSP